MNKESFIEELKKINIIINDNQLKQLDLYYELLIEWNEKINLTGITEKNEVYLKHFYDSSTMNMVINLNNVKKLCDIGTGAGFPGIVIKILFPNIFVTLVDSLEKRCKFLNIVINELKLDNIEVIHDRAEDFSKKHREEYDVVTSRAVAKLNTLLEYSVPIAKINGKIIELKGNIQDELENSMNAITKLDIEIEKIYNFKLPYENSNRNIIVFNKKKSTNIIFPRKISEMKKNSL